jgi:hypothetical protein
LLSPALPSPQRLVCPEAGANCGLQLERIVGSSFWANETINPKLPKPFLHPA